MLELFSEIYDKIRFLTYGSDHGRQAFLTKAAIREPVLALLPLIRMFQGPGGRGCRQHDTKNPSLR